MEWFLYLATHQHFGHLINAFLFVAHKNNRFNCRIFIIHYSNWFPFLTFWPYSLIFTLNCFIKYFKNNKNTKTLSLNSLPEKRIKKRNKTKRENKRQIEGLQWNYQSFCIHRHQGFVFCVPSLAIGRKYKSYCVIFWVSIEKSEWYSLSSHIQG